MHYVCQVDRPIPPSSVVVVFPGPEGTDWTSIRVSQEVVGRVVNVVWDRTYVHKSTLELSSRAKRGAASGDPQPAAVDASKAESNKRTMTQTGGQRTGTLPY